MSEWVIYATAFYFILFFSFGVQSANMTWIRLSSAEESYICNEALGE